MDCIFCRIISKEIPARILAESGRSIAMLDAFPLAPGHVLVLPKRHAQKLQDLQAVENADLFALVQAMADRVDSAMTGSTLIAIHNGREAGQEIPHLHVHVVPRSRDDSAGAIHSMFGSTEISDGETDRIFSMLNTGAADSRSEPSQKIAGT